MTPNDGAQILIPVSDGPNDLTLLIRGPVEHRCVHLTLLGVGQVKALIHQITTGNFPIPEDKLNLVTDQEGFSLGWFIIGEIDTPPHGPSPLEKITSAYKLPKIAPWSGLFAMTYNTVVRCGVMTPLMYFGDGFLIPPPPFPFIPDNLMQSIIEVTKANQAHQLSTIEVLARNHYVKTACRAEIEKDGIVPFLQMLLSCHPGIKPEELSEVVKWATNADNNTPPPELVVRHLMVCDETATVPFNLEAIINYFIDGSTNWPLRIRQMVKYFFNVHNYMHEPIDMYIETTKEEAEQVFYLMEHLRVNSDGNCHLCGIMNLCGEIGMHPYARVDEEKTVGKAPRYFANIYFINRNSQLYPGSKQMIIREDSLTMNEHFPH